MRIRKRRLGAISAEAQQEIDRLRARLAKKEQDIAEETNDEARKLLEKAAENIRAKIANLEGGSAPSPTAKDKGDECKNLQEENKRLREQLKKRGQERSAEKKEGKTTRRRKRTTAQKEGKTTGGRTKTAGKEGGETGGGKTTKTRTRKTAGKEGGETTTPKAPKQPTEKQIKDRAAKEQKETEKNAKAQAKAQGISEKVATKLVSYAFVQSAVAKMLRYKGKPMSYNVAYKFYQDTLLANQAGKFNSQTPAFPQIKKIFEVLEKNLNSPTFKDNKGGDISEDFTKTDWDLFEEIAELNRGFLTAKFAQQFVNISKTGDKTKAAALVKRIENAEKRGAVDANTPFYKEMQEAKEKAKASEFMQLSATLKGISKQIKGLNGVLSGLGGLGCTCQDYAKHIGDLVMEESDAGKFTASRRANDEATTMTAPEVLKQEYECYEFEGKWRDLFYYPGTNMSAMIFGNPGSGKSTLCLQFAQYLADKESLSVLYVSAEEYDSKTLQDNLVLNGVDSPNIVFTDHYDAHDLNQYDFVFFDSVQRLHLSKEEYLDLLEQYPQVAFILVFQVTKNGAFQGKKHWEHDVDAVVEVIQGVAHNGKRYSGNKPVQIFKKRDSSR